MLSKLVSVLAALLMIFDFLFPAQPEKYESGDILKEQIPAFDENKTYDKINGVNGSVFYIQRPADTVDSVNASEFGMSEESEDNFPALLRALEYCKTNSCTKLVIDCGTYYMKNVSEALLDGFENILIDGNNSRIILSEVNAAFVIRGCDCVEFRNIMFDWDRENKPLSDIVTVRNVSKRSKELDFVFERDNVEEDMIIAAVSQCDPESLTYGAKYSNKEVYVYMQPECIISRKKTAGNVIHIRHDGTFSSFADGDTFIIRHYVYDTSFAVMNGGSRNITFDNVSVFGYPGSGFIANEKSSHFQIINSYIGVERGHENEYHTSLGADAIHIVNSDGCFNISGCDISGQGDDALNVHDGLGVVKAVNGNTIKLLGNGMFLRNGDVLHFRDERFNDTDTEAVISDLTYHNDGTYYDITLDRDISGIVSEGYIAYDLSCCSDNYVIRDNFIHENRARGFLLQSPNGLCENNRFYKTEMQAIKIVMDITTGLWYEGTGVDSLVIRNNSFDMCDYISTGEVITAGTNIDGAVAQSRPFTNIEISGNTFTEFPSRVINVNNVNGFVFKDNVIDAGKTMPKSPSSARAYFGKYSSDIVFENNSWENCLLGDKAEAQTPAVWARINSR